jgi:hypothetical protein
MKHINRDALGVIAALVLAGCGGQVAPTGGAQSLAPATHGKSWMLPGTSSGNLIYAVGGCGGTCVISYADGALVGSLEVRGDGACSDVNGNVFISSNATVTEYAHGGTNPINTLSLPGSEASGCSVDPTTNDLAVVFEGSGKNIAVFANEQGSPSLYLSKLDSSFCGYDASGNLFVNGFVGQSPGLAELPAGGSAFNQISVPYSVEDPGQLQWDGSYLAWEAGEARGPRTISRLSVSGSQAIIVSRRFLHGLSYASQLWIYKNTVVVPFAHSHLAPRQIGIWEYPKLRKRKVFDFQKGDDFQAVTVSVAPSGPHK